jgi:phosphatidylglycerophosphate synthase
VTRETKVDMGPQQLGKWLIVFGGIVIVAGLLMTLLGKIGFFRLPGDFEFGGRNWRVYVPLGTCILLSLMLTLILRLISYFRR